MSLKDRYPHLFETYELDASGRPVPSADDPTKLAVTGSRLPSAVELVKEIMTSHGYTGNAAIASDIVSSLAELIDLAAEPAQEEQPATPAPASKPTPAPAPAPSPSPAPAPAPAKGV